MPLLLIGGLVVFSNPGKAPPHPFDSFTRSGEISFKTFSGRINPAYFDHIWVLASPDLQAWWDPNGMRAEADLIIDSGNSELIREAVEVAAPEGSLKDHARTRPEGRIYHVLLFDTRHREYAHLRFEYRSEHKGGSVGFMLLTDDEGAHPVKDCPGFADFERRWLLPEMEKQR